MPTSWGMTSQSIFEGSVVVTAYDINLDAVWRGLMVDIDFMQAGDSWQNWVFTITYLSFLLFVVWRVIVSSVPPSD